MTFMGVAPTGALLGAALGNQRSDSSEILSSGVVIENPNGLNLWHTWFAVSPYFLNIDGRT
jgi:hypothetical protein